MTKKHTVIIPIYQSKDELCDYIKQTAKILVDKNHQVYFLDTSRAIHFFSLRKIFQKVSLLHHTQSDISKTNILHPIKIFPFQRFNFINQLNISLSFIIWQVILFFKHRRSNRYLVWSFFPELLPYYQPIISPWKMLYDIVDYHTHSDKKLNILLKKRRQQLLNKSQFIFSISNSLAQLLQPNASKQIVVTPQGFDQSSYLEASTIKNSKKLFPKKSRPVIGFIGQISERLDFSLLTTLIGNNPQWKFVFVGSIHHEPNVSKKNRDTTTKFHKLKKFKNCAHISPQPRSDLLQLLNQFDICMIPYDTSFLFNKFSYPMKLFEYFFVGKPVISTPIKELTLPIFHKLVFIGKDAKEWEKHINHLLSSEWPLGNIIKQKQMAINNSWEKKIGKILFEIDK